MSSVMRVGLRLAVLGLASIVPSIVCGQSAFAPQGAEYKLSGALPGDQVYGSVALGPSGGYVVWQDSFTDGNEVGISARRVDSSLSGSYSPFRVNSIGAGRQEKPAVAVMKNGGAAFVWQGQPSTDSAVQRIYARFVGADGQFTTPADIQVNSHTAATKLDAVVAGLADGNAVVVWGSHGQDDAGNSSQTLRDLQGVYAQRLSPNGAKLGGEFQVNQFATYNQRTPAVAVLANGDFVVVWYSERVVVGMAPLSVTTVLRDSHVVDIYGRIFQSNGTPRGDEFKINDGVNLCANPSVTATANGFSVAWGEIDRVLIDNGRDVFARPFNQSGTQLSPSFRVNSYAFGDQYAPRICSMNGEELVVWNSVGQGGKGGGIYGRFIKYGNALASDEMRANQSSWFNPSFAPAVAANGENGFVAVWSSYDPVEGLGGDVYAQRFLNALPKPGAPFVSGLSQTRLSVTWPPVSGMDVKAYELYVDGATAPVIVSNITFTLSGLQASSTHTFRIAYRALNPQGLLVSSPISDIVSGKTWGLDGDDQYTEVPDGLPDDWQVVHWGANPALWSAPNADSDGDGVSNVKEYLAGTNPVDANSVLKTLIQQGQDGFRLHWNTQPGLVYQVQFSTNLTTWSELGTLRFAPGSTDSVLVNGPLSAVYYRIVRIR